MSLFSSKDISKRWKDKVQSGKSHLHSIYITYITKRSYAERYETDNSLKKNGQNLKQAIYVRGDPNVW